MKNKILFCLFIVTLTSCKTPCNDPSSLPNITADFLIKQWECKNTTKVKNDVTHWMTDRNWCEQAKGDRGVLSGLVCSFIIDELQAYGAYEINHELLWDCNPNLVGKDAAIGFKGLCSLIPF